LKNLSGSCLTLAVTLWLILISGCVPSELEDIPDSSDNNFPVQLIADVQLPERQQLEQEQIAYCSYNPLSSGLRPTWNIMIRSIGGTKENMVDGTLEVPEAFVRPGTNVLTLAFRRPDGTAREVRRSAAIATVALSPGK
jgi:hypothetical protein